MYDTERMQGKGEKWEIKKKKIEKITYTQPSFSKEIWLPIDQ